MTDFAKLSAYTAAFIHESDERIRKIEKDARERGIPIIQPDSIAFLRQLIRWLKPGRILEIGTAVGYSAIKMCGSTIPHADIVTIERDEKMLHEASENIKLMGLEKHIRLIFGDAGEDLPEVAEDGPYDFIFIDAAKAQYRKFFSRYAPLLSEKGIIVSDNVLFHGLVADPIPETAKRLKRLADKVNDYNYWLSEHPEFDTVFLTVGDGLAISTRKT